MTDMEMILQAIKDLKDDVNNVNKRFDNVESDIKEIKERVTRLEITVENDIKKDIKKLSEHQLGLRETVEEYKASVDDRIGTSDLINILTEYSRNHR